MNASIPQMINRYLFILTTFLLVLLDISTGSGAFALPIARYVPMAPFALVIHGVAGALLMIHHVRVYLTWSTPLLLQVYHKVTIEEAKKSIAKKRKQQYKKQRFVKKLFLNGIANIRPIVEAQQRKHK